MAYLQTFKGVISTHLGCESSCKAGMTGYVVNSK